MKDGKATTNYDSNESYTQRDALREAYVDTEMNDWSIRAGKQQVVWGTADGMKLLDTINPTDYSEMAQNQMEDSRIPVWMINAEKDLEDGSNFQVVISQAKENKIAGLNASGDQGQAFIMKGVDSITGKRNGFLNVTPALAGVASTFDFAASNGGFVTSPTTQSNSLAAFTSMTVDGFGGNAVATSGGYDATTGAALGIMLANGQSLTTGGNTYTYASGSATNGINLLYGMAENGATGYTTYANNGATNLVDAAWNPSSATSAFEYMPAATFATFNTFSKTAGNYVRDYPNSTDGNIGFRFKKSLPSGLNYSLNYLNHYDANPYIDLSWNDVSSGEKLNVTYVEGGSGTTGLPVTTVANGTGTIEGTVISAADIKTSITSRTQAQAVAIDAAAYAGDGAMVPYLQGAALDAVTVLLSDSAGHYYGAKNWTTAGTANTAYNDVELRFTEKLNRINSIGGSFDTAVETEKLGAVVVRGEVLFNKDEMKPVVDKRVLAIGDLAGALTMKKSDTLKFVLGADITVLTNMMVSAQLIQLRDLDYIDENLTCTSQLGASYDCSKYTGDMATLHMSNGLNKGEENKEFYSLFFSKPFGASGEHRWNNIFMFEENGGKWNRLDAEFSIDDDTQATVEYNKYWGDANTQFGQLEKSSNVQVGVKYSF
ncbi:MAG: RNA polymerase-associated protein rapA [Candidatus Thioglobus sp.]|nr:RNA polymerase-associated protein rapA [Candidatus Thioglobus sp.]